MSWAGLADNQIVSFNNLQDAVNTGQFTALTTIPASNEEITKTDASTYVNCWTGYSLFANKASNQLIAKRDLVTTTTTTTAGCAYYLSISAQYLAIYELQIVLNIVGGTPSYAFDLSFDWCTDSGAFGSTTLYVNSGYTGTLTGISINLSMYGATSGGTTWGSQDAFVSTTSTGTVTQMYVVGSTINLATTDPTCTYYISYENVDNACANQSSVTDECLVNC
jgi:hypothetical protein